MIISFLSPTSNIGTTAAVAAISTAFVIESEKTVYAMQTGITDSSLDNILSSTNSITKVFDDDFMDIGIDSLLRRAKAMKLQKSNILNSSSTIIRNKFDVLSSTKKKNQEQYEKELVPYINGIVDDISLNYDNIFIDGSNCGDELKNKIEDSSDVVIICLEQSIVSIKKAYDYCNYLLNEKKKKVFFLITKYNENSKYNIKNIKRMQRIKGVPTLSIPYSVGLMDSYSDSSLYNFILHNISCKPGDINYLFSTELRRAFESINKLTQGE